MSAIMKYKDLAELLLNHHHFANNCSN